jgi:DNA recombination protein RmuC
MIGSMTTATVFGLLAALAVGALLGWLAHARIAGPAAAQLDPATAGREAGEALGREVQDVVEPLRQALHSLGEHVGQLERSRINAYAGLREQVMSVQRSSHLLSEQTGQLVAALRAPTVRGRWGEVQLRRVVELAGMQRHCDFDLQVAGDGVRPDMVVRLSGGRNLVVDAKVPFEAYLDAAQAEDPDEREAHLRRHARHVRAHVDALAGKAYWAAFEPSPEFVVLFLPGDPFLDAAASVDAQLLEHAFSRNVIIATPTTLMALLRTVAHVWRQDAATREAATVQQLGRELFARLAVAGRSLDGLGAQLAKAVESFNTTAASMESRVWATARKLSEMDLVTGDPPEVRRVEVLPRGVRLADPDSHTSQVGDLLG